MRRVVEELPLHPRQGRKSGHVEVYGVDEGLDLPWHLRRAHGA
ncbi:Uncharacterised protein [Bordetella pertussis]|nr:Uncharacterised protein [Bordetella pertussis]